MGRHAVLIGLLLAGMSAVQAPAAIYVATNGTHDAANRFDTWAGAATNIQAAVAVALNGDSILVSNGVYLTGAELVVPTNVTMSSVAGPEVTAIARNAAAGAFRVVRLLGAGAQLSGFTISNGSFNANGVGVNLTAGTLMSNCVVKSCAVTAKVYGNAVYAAGATLVGCTITNCSDTNAKGVVVLTGGSTMEDSTLAGCGFQTFAALYLMGSGNTANRCRIYNNLTGQYTTSAGVYVDDGSALINCLVYGNQANRAGASCGGVYLKAGRVLNCTIADNSIAGLGVGGLQRTAGSVTNCIISGNKAYGVKSDYSGATSAVVYSCAPELTLGTGNVPATPQFVNAAAGDYRLIPASPCVDAGVAIPGLTLDLAKTARSQDGNGDGSAVTDMGALETEDASALPLQVGFSAWPVEALDSLNVTLTPLAAGGNRDIVWHGWDWNGDGTVDQTGGAFAPASHTFGVGWFSPVLLASNSAGQSASFTNVNAIHVVSHDIYVATNGLHTGSFAMWGNAATSILAAVAEAIPGCTIHVSNGVFYAKSEIGLNSNVTLIGENGPAGAVLARDAAGGVFRVIALKAWDAKLAGVTISNGSSSADGGGVWMAPGTVMSNCVVRECGLTAKVLGNGVYANGGRIVDCAITNCDYTQGKGVAVLTGGTTIEDSIVAESTFQSFGALYLMGSGNTANRCRIFNNLTGQYGTAGGALVEAGSTMINCLVFGNQATPAGSLCGGVYMSGGRLLNCTIASNTIAGAVAGGVRVIAGGVTNCIISYNIANGTAQNYSGAVAAVSYSCASELTAGFQHNIASDPLFKNAAAGNFRLSAGSPCRNAGWLYAGAAADLDLDGQPRMLQGAVDMGAYELPPPPGTVMMIR